jgi:PD-(D/E)XK nuclease superfamily
MTALLKTLKTTPIPKKSSEPLWAGPEDSGPKGGVTQSMLQRFLCCRERFRIKYFEGLQPTQGWSKPMGFGNMWHVCEEAAAANKDHKEPLIAYMRQQFEEFPYERETIEHWATICLVQFPCYQKFWREHPDQDQRLPLLQEAEFHVPIKLPSGRTIYLRGKWDSVDLIDKGENAGVWLMENKTKSKIDEAALRRQLKFDLQTMTYLTSLLLYFRGLTPQGWVDLRDSVGGTKVIPSDIRLGGQLQGVRYNVIRRDMPIRQHKPSKSNPRGEGVDEYFERFKRDYLDAEPENWFKRWNSKVTPKEIQRFQSECLFPILEQLCDWYDWIRNCHGMKIDPYKNPIHWRAPFGVYDPIKETGATEYDSYIESGNSTGLVYRPRLFPELTCEKKG